MRVKVKQDACIGCGGCVSICPEVFEFNDEGFAHVTNTDIKDELKERVIEALENCPTEAIEEIKND